MTSLFYIIRRILWMIPALLIAVFIIFVLARVIPGNPVYLIVGSMDAGPEVYERVTREMGLDRPILVQFWMYLGDLAHFDLGTAWHTSNPVEVDIAARLPATFELAGAAFLLSLFIGIPLGVFAAIAKDKIADHNIRIGSLLGISIPEFWLGLVLVYVLAFQLGIFPLPISRIGIAVSPPEHITGMYTVDSILTGNMEALKSSFSYLILPTVTLALGQIAGITRLVRNTMVEVLVSDYIRAARAFGIRDNRIHFRYALKNTLIPTMTFIAGGVLYLLGRAVVVEVVFTWPGLGLYAMQSIFVKDYQGVQGVTLLMAVISVTVYLVVDILYYMVDPRVKY